MNKLPEPLLVGMVHLPALPGSPASRLALNAIVEHALADARTLQKAGFNALLVENFGDTPFAPRRIEPVTIAGMAVIVREVLRNTELLVGVNCLRNDAAASLGIAAAVGAHFIRVNVHTGAAATDQGLISGKAHRTLRDRMRLGPSIRIFADVHVKHATPLGQQDIALAAEEAAYRGMADGLIVTGRSTGRPVDFDDLKRVKRAVPDKPVLVGSGASPASIKALLEVADGVIVGTSLKADGDTANPIDAALARQFIANAS